MEVGIGLGWVVGFGRPELGDEVWFGLRDLA